MREDDARALWQSDIGSKVKRRLEMSRHVNRPPATQSIYAAKQADMLVGKPEWDWLLQRLGERLDSCSKARDVQLEELRSPQLILTAEETMERRHRLIVLETEIRTIKWLADLPKNALDEGKTARKELAS